jgi:hypothetical protein
MLGREIIRDLNETPSLRKVPVERLLCDVIDGDAGPLIHHGEAPQTALCVVWQSAGRTVNTPVETPRVPNESGLSGCCT